MNIKKVGLILVFAFVMTGFIFAERPAVPNSSIQGTVLDSTERAPLEYANIMLFEQENDEMLEGTTTDGSGFFIFDDIPAGQYFVRINYMGYKSDTVKLEIAPEYSEVNLGDIFLPRRYLELSGVEATAENISIDYQIDKKVLNVNRQQSSISGSAVNILENAPSVTTDIEGNVELRGSSNFRVLINGKPTVQDANDVLLQTPASTIEKIEIITNPSAKYNPEGSAGIINLVLKKNRLRGISGMATINGGSYNRHGGEVLLNYNKQKINTTLSLDYNDRPSPGSGWRESQTTTNDTTSYIYSTGDNERKHKHYGLRGSIEYLPDTNNTIKLSLRAGSRNGRHESNEILQTWTMTQSQLIQDTTVQDNLNNGLFGGDFYSLNLNYNRQFPGQAHQLESNMNISRRSGGHESIDKQLNKLGNVVSGTKSIEEGPRIRWEFKMDYTLPLKNGQKFEAGLQNRGRTGTEINENYTYDTNLNDFVHQPKYDHEVENNRNIGALYSIYSGEKNDFGYQTGLRTEYTYRKIKSLNDGSQFNIDRWDIFPTLHLSYKLNQKQEMMLSYTRRIDRPRGWFLEPFETWSGPYDIRKGNPELTPEYINSLELGYKLEFDRSFLSLETYYRNTVDKIERVRSVHPDYKNVYLHSFDNVGEDHSLGSEVMLNLNIYKWWNLNLSGNLYNYRVVGQLNDQNFDRESFNWTTRLNNTFSIDQKTKFQINNIYNSPSVSSQGKRKGFFLTNASIRRNFLGSKLTAILQARDIFDTGEWEFESQGKDFYMQRRFDRQSPTFSITLRYNINRYRNRRQGQRGQGDAGSGFDVGGMEGGEY